MSSEGPYPRYAAPSSGQDTYSQGAGASYGAAPGYGAPGYGGGAPGYGGQTGYGQGQGAGYGGSQPSGSGDWNQVCLALVIPRTESATMTTKWFGVNALGG